MTDQRRSLREFRSKDEGAHLEFKDPRVLRDPYSVAREVCAFLNSGGGELVIGIGDDGSIQPIDKPEGEERRLLDSLAALIAPSLPSRVHVDSIDGDGILVTVDSSSREEQKLFAVRSSKGRVGVFRRVGDRVVTLDWAEIRDELRRESLGERDLASDTSAEKLLLDWRRDDLESSVLERAGALILVWNLRPRIANGRAVEAEGPIRTAIEDPTTIGLRRDGADYSMGKCKKTKRYTLASGSTHELYQALELDLRGTLRFATRLDTLLGDRVSGCPRSKTIYPLSLIEMIASCSSLFRELIERTKAHGTVTCALDLAGIQGHSLPPYRHGTLGFLHGSRWQAPFEGNGLSEILKASVDARAFAENPHRIAHELISWIYLEFGYDSELGPEGEKVPYWEPTGAQFEFPA